jgi:hypothetical protein
MESISPYQLRHYFGASGDELVKIRLLVDPDENGDFPRAEAARALLAIRQGTRRTDPITEQFMARQQQERPLHGVAGLLQRLRRAPSRRVPQ